MKESRNESCYNNDNVTFVETSFFDNLVKQIYNDTKSMHGCREVSPDTFSMHIGMDEV